MVRSKEEIFSTLDAQARIDGLIFQPEMLAYCGRRLRVAKTAHKTCDSSVNRTGGRKLYDTVHLEGARCAGELHDGCQADCVFYWKEAWLMRADGNSPALPANPQPGSDANNPTWVCQTTSIYEASELLPWWDVRQYIRDVTGGNHSAWHMIKIMIRAGYSKVVGLGFGYRLLVGLYDSWQRLFGGKPFPNIQGQLKPGQSTPASDLNLQPGEWVEVKSRDEIAATVTADGFNRGMRYDPEMLKYSGDRYRVQMRVDKLINEKDGKMVRMKTACIQLENVYCRAECTAMRLGCPRASNTYWREIWLKRSDPPTSTQ
ncbi:MAG TPA: hypothetical protein VK629_01855 [Steroidobacteraceae bacterium]|nr:hypothetical protein [Steroidobacteraceae bacterium]